MLLLFIIRFVFGFGGFFFFAVFLDNSLQNARDQVGKNSQHPGAVWKGKATREKALRVGL